MSGRVTAPPQGDPFAQDVLTGLPARFSHPVTIRFQDVDAAGIVFFPRILELFHDAYVAFLAHAGLPLDRVLTERRWLAPLRHAEGDFLRPLRFGERVSVDLVRAQLDRSKLTVGYRLARGDQACAVGRTVHLFLDAAGGRIDAPDEVRAAFAPLA